MYSGTCCKDDELIEELRIRFNENKMNLIELQKLSEHLKDVNRKLTESESLKSHFLSNIRNEINNPMTAILGLSQNIMQNNEADSEKVKDLASLIFKEAFNLDFQLKTIFAAAEIESGEMHLHLTNVDVEKMIEKIMNAFVDCADEKGIQLHFNKIDSPAHSNFCQTDSEKLHLVLSNLISNAIIFSHPDSIVQIKLWYEGDQLLIAIQDQGIGIAKSDQDRIFDRFIQLQTGSTKTFRGHGLGLCVVRDMLQILKGTIRLDSIPEKGSTFTLSIPMRHSEEEVLTFSETDNEEVF